MGLCDAYQRFMWVNIGDFGEFFLLIIVFYPLFLYYNIIMYPS